MTKKQIHINIDEKVDKCVQYDPSTKAIRLSTRHTSYQMQIGELGELRHLYYGPFVGACTISDRISRRDVGFSGNPYDAGRDRTYSFDTLPLEYSSRGSGDYRPCSISVSDDRGDRACDLRIAAVEGWAGKYGIPGLPAVFSDDDQSASTCRITLLDAVRRLRVELYYGVLYDRDVITRYTRITNEGDRTVELEQADSFLLDVPQEKWELQHFCGRHTQERMPVTEPLLPGSKVLESRRGTSSHQHNPFIILKKSHVTEESGWCMGVALVYSGGFHLTAHVDQTGGLRLTGGIHPSLFKWRLLPGASFETPEAIMTVTRHGLSRLSHLFHTLYRKNMIRSPYVEKPRPLLVNNWEATYFDFTVDKLLAIADRAKEIGLDMLVLDDGWFGKRDDDFSGLGDWYVNDKKLPGGIGVLAEQIRSRGMKFGLWIEPEMISEDSDLYRAHPDWAFTIPGRDPVRARHQLNLDVGRAEVRDYVLEQIFCVLDACRADYVKWDMNRSLDNVFASDLPVDRQGEALHRYVLGVYDMMERLVRRYPDILFENCSGGGGRFDAGMLYYSPQIWCSDNTDAVERLMIQYGTSFGYPPSAMGAHVSVVPNHQTGRIVPFETRCIVAGAGTFGFELDLTAMDQEEMEKAKEAVRQYRSRESLVLSGAYDRLSDPGKDGVGFWQFTSPDRSRALVAGVILYAHSNAPGPRIFPRRLDPQANYRCTMTGEERTGAGWMYGGVGLAACTGDYQALSFELTRCEPHISP